MISDTANTVRAVLGQGLAMGWGDEAEAWLRSKLGDEEYEQALAEIRSQYGTFAEESPYLSGIGEFTGAAVPAVAAMLVPGGQAAIPATAARTAGPLSRIFGLGKTAGQRTTGQNLARLGTVGGVQGTVSGAGAAEGDRTSGAITGGGFGTVTSLALPFLGRAVKGTLGTVRDLAGVPPNKAKLWAREKLGMALDDEDPSVIAEKIRRDIEMGIPPSVANVTPGTMQLAESVIQRGGKPARELEEKIAQQQAGSRERVGQQVQRRVSDKKFYEEEGEMLSNLRRNANTVYEQAYAVGDINDPIINRVLQDPEFGPEFADLFDRAKKIMAKHKAAEMLGDGDPGKYTLKQVLDPQTGKFTELPDVRTLDYIKQGIDEKIGELFNAGKSVEARALKEVRTRFVDRLDALVPEYKSARAQYKGDIEVLEALRLGRDEFNKMDPEQVQALMKDMSKGELDAFRTGVARNLFDQIMDPTTNIDAARKLIGSPSTRAAIEAVIETPAQRELFMAALQRETELFKAASRMLAGSPTEKRRSMRESLEARPGVAEAAAEAIDRGFGGSMLMGLLSLFRRGVPDEYYQELANLLKNGDPAEITAVVQLLEEAAQMRVPRKTAMGAFEAGTVGGTIGAAPPAPMTEEERREAERLGLL